MPSFAPEIQTSDGAWSRNSLRFATTEEADAYGEDLAGRWIAVKDTRVIPTEDPVNYRWDFGQYKLVAIVPDAPIPVPSRSVT